MDKNIPFSIEIPTSELLKPRAWNGSAWVQAYVSVWNGTSWSTTK